MGDKWGGKFPLVYGGRPLAGCSQQQGRRAYVVWRSTPQRAASGFASALTLLTLEKDRDGGGPLALGTLSLIHAVVVHILRSGVQDRRRDGRRVVEVSVVVAQRRDIATTAHAAALRAQRARERTHGWHAVGTDE